MRVLLLKMMLSPALIGLASWVSRRWGASAGGWFAALPLTSGPVMFIIALERGPAFAAHASLGTLLAVISLAAFVLAYVWLSRWLSSRGHFDAATADAWYRGHSDVAPTGARHHGHSDVAPAGAWHRRRSDAAPDGARHRANWAVCSIAGCTAYLACTWALHGASLSPRLSLSLLLSFAVVCVVLIVTLRAMPVDASQRAAATATVAVWWDIPLRMMLAAALVFTLTRIAGTLGPQLSGLLTPFPIAVTILAAFTHHFDGAAAAARLLRGLVAGLFSFALFFLIAGLAIAHWPPFVTFAAATLTALAWHAVVWTMTRDGKGDVRAALAAVVHRRRVARGL